MLSDSFDLLGWGLTFSAASLAIVSLGNLGYETSLLASAVLLLIIADRRRTKVVSTSCIQFVDKDGKTRGHARWNGEGIELGIFVSNFSVLKPGFLEDGPHIFFTFHSNTIISSESDLNPDLPVPQIRVHNYPISRAKGYSYSLDFSLTGDEPSLDVTQVGYDKEAKQSIDKNWKINMEKWRG